LELATALASGLSFLHDSGLVHRDIKPANIIFVNGAPKLADIGLVAQDGAKTSLGTPGYVPTEGPGRIPADIFSFGKVICEMATGKSAAEFPSLPTKLYESSDHELFADLNEVITKACDPA